MKPQRAFTFVEIMLVGTIIAVLAAIAVPNFIEAQTRAEVARSKSELTSLKMGIESYRLEYRGYPLNQKTGEFSKDDLRVLTTPLAFLPTLPLDTMRRRRTRSERVVDRTPRPFGYLNLKQLDPEGSARLHDAAWDMKGGLLDALIWGHGPHLDTPAFPPELKDSENPMQVLSKSLIPYDPSNGTIALGHVFWRIP